MTTTKKIACAVLAALSLTSLCSYATREEEQTVVLREKLTMQLGNEERRLAALAEQKQLKQAFEIKMKELHHHYGVQ